MLTSQPLSFKMASVRRSSPYVRHSFASRLGETSLLVDLVTPTLLHYTQPQTIASTLYSPDSTSNNEPPPSSSNSHSLTHLPPPIHRLQHILYRWSLRRFLGPAMSDQPHSTSLNSDGKGSAIAGSELEPAELGASRSLFLAPAGCQL
jgi:hypothetical protein